MFLLVLLNVPGSFAQDREPTQEEIDLIRERISSEGLFTLPVELEPSEISASDFTLEYVFYTGRTLSVRSENTRGTEIRSDGTRFYVLGRQSMNISEYRLETPWNIQSAIYTREFDLSGSIGSGVNSDSVPHGIYIRQSDGRRLWVMNRTEIWEYDLERAWDITSATLNDYIDLSSRVLRGHDIHFSPDGRTLYIDDRVVNAVFQYQLSTPWSISSAQIQHVLDLPNTFLEVRGTQLNREGTRMYILDTGTQRVNEFRLSNPFDIRSASFIGFYSVANQTLDPRSITFNSDYSGFYIGDASLERIFQYRVSPAPDRNLSLISTSAEKVRANNRDSATITVSARDRDNQPLPGFRVRLFSGSGAFDSSPSTAITNTQGVAQFDVRNGSVTTTELGAMIGNETISNRVTVDFIGVDPQLSELFQSADRILADGTSQAEIRVIAKDEFNQPFENIRVTLIPQSGNSVIEEVQRRTDENGVALFRVSNTTSERVVYEVSAFGTTLERRAEVNFVRLDPALSTVNAQESRVQANGVAKAQIAVAVRDRDNMPIQNVIVQVEAEYGSALIDAMNSRTDDDGIARFLVSNTVVETVRFRASGMGTQISQAIDIEFIGVDPVLSSLSISNEVITADGNDFSTVTITAKDDESRLFTDIEFSLTAQEGSSQIESLQPVTNKEGIALFRVRNSEIERVTFTASAMGIELDETVTVLFVPRTPVILTASTVEERELTANWEVVNGVEGFLLELSEDSLFTVSSPSYSKTDVGFVTSQRVVGLTPGTDYFYRVRAYKGEFESKWSKITPVTTFPEPPQSIAAAGVNARFFQAGWRAAEGAREYLLDVATDSDFNNTLEEYSDLNVGSELSHEVTDLEPNQLYFFRVRSQAGPRKSDYSAVQQLRTLTISPTESQITQEQLRTLANGIQTNEVVVAARSDEGIPLVNLSVDLIPTGNRAGEEPVEGITDQDGIARFDLSSASAGLHEFIVRVYNQEIGVFQIEFLSDSGQLALGDNYPNPFVRTTTIPVTVPRQMAVQLQIFDATGRRIQTPLNQTLDAGYYEVPFNAHGLAAGIYFYRLIADGKILSETMILVR